MIKNLKLTICGFLLCCMAANAWAQEDSCCKNADKMNKTISVKEVTFNSQTPGAKEIDEMFDAQNIGYHSIDVVNWDGVNGNYAPQVQFRIAYSPTEIYLQYKVKETCVKAVYGEDAGSAPYKDSCLEFFCIPDSVSRAYYNLELNCIGKGTFAGGAERTGRTKYGDDVLSQIRRHSTLGSEAFGIKEAAEGEVFEYTVTVALPIRLFSLSAEQPLVLKGKTIKGNFYKCGDDMPQRHYLSWNPIGTERPNFHTPAYFGNIHFE